MDEHNQPGLLGIAYGVTAAVGYSLANLALRRLSEGDGGFGWDLWISGTKAAPTAVISFCLLLIAWKRGHRCFPDRRATLLVLMTAFLMQFGGNLGFQVALRAVGLAVTVPVVFASLIISAAIAGRTVLGDPVNLRIGFSMALMTGSIVFLSISVASSGDVTPVTDGAVAAPVSYNLAGLRGIVAGLISGASYGLSGVVIRKVVRARLPVASTLIIFSVVGLLTLCPAGLLLLGLPRIAAVDARSWQLIATAGVMNAIAFFAVTHAMKRMSINRVNLINASQNAMCAVGAAIVFQEILTPWAHVGIGLSILGLIVLGRRP